MSTDLATIAGAALGTAAVLFSAFGYIALRLRPIMHVLDDLVGEAARPGRQRQPGLLERMETNESAVQDAANQSLAAKQSAWRTEDLVRRHMRNGLEIMEVGVHNDMRVFTALKDAGIEVTDLRDYPAVDIGEDRND